MATRPSDDIASIAADLGYTDQSHLAGDFRAVAGITPSTYRRDLARLQNGSLPRWFGKRNNGMAVRNLPAVRRVWVRHRRAASR